MNLTNALRDMRRGLGYKTALDVSLIDALNSVKRTLEQGVSLPDFLLVYDAPITVTADSEVIALPTGFLRMSDKFDMYYINSDNGRVKVPLKTEAEGRAAYGDLTDKQYASVWALRLPSAGVVIPVPTLSATYYLTYYKAADDFALGNETNLWLTYLPDILVGTAGLEVCDAIGYKEGRTYFQNRLVRGEKARMGGIVDAELQGRGLIMGRNK